MTNDHQKHNNSVNSFHNICIFMNLNKKKTRRHKHLCNYYFWQLINQNKNSNLKSIGSYRAWHLIIIYCQYTTFYSSSKVTFTQNNPSLVMAWIASFTSSLCEDSCPVVRIPYEISVVWFVVGDVLLLTLTDLLHPIFFSGSLHRCIPHIHSPPEWRRELPGGQKETEVWRTAQCARGPCSQGRCIQTSLTCPPGNCCSLSCPQMDISSLFHLQLGILAQQPKLQWLHRHSRPIQQRQTEMRKQNSASDNGFRSSLPHSSLCPRLWWLSSLGTS